MLIDSAVQMATSLGTEPHGPRHAVLDTVRLRLIVDTAGSIGQRRPWAWPQACVRRSFRPAVVTLATFVLLSLFYPRAAEVKRKW